MGNFKKALGIFILSSAFIFLFVLTTHKTSFLEALIGWGVALGISGVIVGAVFLIFDDSE